VQDKDKDERRQYKPVVERTREQVEEMLRSGVPEQISEALWSATYHDPDWRWVQSRCLSSLAHGDVWVRRNAATCLGLLAVLRQQLDLDIVLPALHRAAEDAEIRAWVEDSLSDIRHNLKTQ
jgi:hypothetical protein